MTIGKIRAQNPNVNSPNNCRPSTVEGPFFSWFYCLAIFYTPLTTDIAPVLKFVLKVFRNNMNEMFRDVTFKISMVV